MRQPSFISYADSLEHLAALQAQDGDAVHPKCRTILLTHGIRTEKVILLIHGYTNCPQQMRPLAERFFERGWNAFIPRLPLHGCKDRLAPGLKNLRRLDLIQAVETYLNIAQGLGEKITVLGLSLGGTLALWLAQQHPELDLAVLVAPFIGPGMLPARLRHLARWLLRWIPNQNLWWDPVHKQDLAGPQYAYPIFATRPLAEFLSLSFEVEQAARSRPPAAGAVVVVTNENDRTVNNIATAQLVERWRKSGAQSLNTYAFPAAWKLDHDLIDENQPHQQVERVYPVLIEQVESHLS